MAGLPHESPSHYTRPSKLRLPLSFLHISLGIKINLRIWERAGFVSLTSGSSVGQVGRELM